MPVEAWRYVDVQSHKNREYIAGLLAQIESFAKFCNDLIT